MRCINACDGVMSGMSKVCRLHVFALLFAGIRVCDYMCDLSDLEHFMLHIIYS